MPGLGKGLLSLIPQADEEVIIGASINEPVYAEENANKISIIVNIEHIKVNPYQPRQVFKHNDLEALICSIKEYGILQPLVVNKDGQNSYELIAGERRLRAAKMLNMAQVPVIIVNHQNSDKLVVALIENIQRQDLNPVEKAYGFKKLIEEFNFTQEEIAKKVGISRSAVANTLRLLNLPTAILSALSDGQITEGHGRLILSVSDPKKQIILFNRIVSGAYSIKDTQKLVQYIYKKIKQDRGDNQNFELQNQLESFLGTKVRITTTKNGFGKITIDFYSLEEMQKIINSILSN